MPFTMTMPKLSPTMESGTIARWIKKVGEHVNAGDVVIEVSTDKATVEHSAIDEGYLRKVLVPDGSEASVNQPIAIFTEKADESIEGYEPEGTVPVQEKSQNKAAAQPPAAPKQTFTPPPQAPVPSTGISTLEEGEDEYHGIKASPLAKKLARDKKLGLSAIKGTGPGGRIVSRDLEHAKPITLSSGGKKALPSTPPGTFIEETLTPIRKVISQRLQESKTYIPHFYVQQVIDAEPITKLREQLIAIHHKISFNDMIIKGSALALQKHPNVNSGFNPTNMTIIRYQTIDVSVAVNVETGLITPIVRYADYKSVFDISAEMAELTKKAREGKTSPSRVSRWIVYRIEYGNVWHHTIYWYYQSSSSCTPFRRRNLRPTCCQRWANRARENFKPNPISRS